MIRETAFARAAKILLEEKDFKVLAKKIFDIGRELTGAASGCIALLSKDGKSDEVLFLEDGGPPCTVDPDLPMPVRGLREQAYTLKRPVFDNDFMKSEWVKLVPPGHVALNNVLFAPLMVDGAAHGIMGLANKPGAGFTDNDAQTADTLAELAAIGLKNHRSEAALRESRDRFFSLFSNMAEGVCLHELLFGSSGEPVNYRILDCNKQYETILELAKERVLGKTATEAYGTAEPPYLKEYAAVALSGKPSVFETFFPPLNKHFSISIAPWEKNGFATIFSDITEREKSAEVLARNEGMLRKAQGLANIGHFRYCPETGLVEGSDMLYKIFGLPNGPAAFETFIEIAHPDDRVYAAKTIADVLKTGNGCTMEHRLVCKDGSRKFIRAIFECEKSHTGHCVILVGTMQDITPQKLAEQALRASKERYRSIVENMNDAFFIHDFSGTIFDCNDNTCRMLGYSRDELVGANLGQIDTPESGRLINQRIQKIIEAGHAEFDSEQVRKDGSHVAVNVSARLVSSKGNGIIQAFIRDITERKKSEEALAASEEIFSKAFRASPMAIGVSELDSGKMIDVNEAFCRTIEYSREEVIGRTGSELGFWVDPGQRDEIVRLIRNPGKNRFIETTCRTKSGKILDVILSAEVLSWKGTKCLLISAFNITDRKKAEEALRTSEKRNRDLLAAIPDLMFRIRKDGTIVDFKFDRPEQLLIPPEKVTGASVFDLPFSAGDLAIVRKSIADSFATNTMQSFQYSLPVAGKNRVYDARAVREDEETVIAIIRDVTELKAAEENQIKTEKLEAVGAMAGGIAHDFNNLLGGVFGYLDMAKEQAELGNTAKVATLLGKALAVFDRARGLTAQFLTFAKGGAPAKKKGDLRKTISETVAFALSGSPVSCTKHIASDLWPCEYDEHQIGQVIDNLVINAKQAMEKGGTLDVSAANATLKKDSPLPLPEGGYVKVSFKDNGPGVPRDLHRNIFDPFFTTKKKGSGLGLATAFSIIKRHGGHIDLESEPGKGATFSFWLPAAQKGAAAEIDAVTAAAASSGIGPAAKANKIRARILVMDDEQYMRDLASSALRSLGYTAAAAKHGEEALAKYAAAAKGKKPFDVVILDLTIPGGMGGKEAAQKLLETDAAACLIVSSGYSDDPIMADPVRYGFTAAISKPYKKELLAGVLSEVLAGKKRSRT